LNINTSICNIEIENPLLPGSGPLTGDAERMLAMANTGVGAIVTKTISSQAAKVVRPCIIQKDGVLMNCEAWSEYPGEDWIEEFLPKARIAVKRPILASVGYCSEDYEKVVPKIDRMVDGYECVVRFHNNSGDYSDVGDNVKTFRNLTQKPIWVKMSATKPEPISFGKACLDAGAQGVVAITSLGPCMVIDIANRRPLIGLASGYSWASGPAIKPIALSTVFMLKTALPDISIIGSGGVATAEDVIEFLLAGADAVEMLSAAMMKGAGLYKKIIDKLPATLERYGFTSIEQVKKERLSLINPSLEPNIPTIDPEKCTGCGICARDCPYSAMFMNGKLATTFEEKCFGCGLCQSVCPVEAITGVLDH